MRFWDNQEVPGRGTKYCLVMDPEDGTHPIRTYGWSKDEVLEKMAKTAEAAQQVINRQRSAQTQQPARHEPARAAAPAQPTSRRLTADEQMQATVDLSNPAKSPEAIKVLLRGVGIDVEKMQQDENIRRVANVAQEWERNHPDFPSDERNQRLLMDKASLMVGFTNITAEALDAAYQSLLNYGMIFDSTGSQISQSTPQVPPDGSSATRIVRPRGATSYRSTNLRAVAPGTRREQPKYTRAEIDAMPSSVFRQKMDSEPGFREWFDREFSSATA